MSSVEICSFKYVKTFIFSTLIRSAGMDHDDYTYWSLDNHGSLILIYTVLTKSEPLNILQ